MKHNRRYGFMKRRGKRIIWIVLSVLFGIIFVLPLAGFGILKWGILPPERLTPLVVSQANALIDGKLDCERVELTYFETYPYLGVKLTNGSLISRQAQDSASRAEDALNVPADSLLSFKKVIVVVNPTEYLFNGKVSIPWVVLDSVRIYGYVNEAGKANWEIYRSAPDTARADTLTTDTTAMPVIDLKRLRIRDARVVYDDRQQDLYTEVDGFSLRMDGELTRRGSKIDLETGFSSIAFYSPSYTLNNHLSMRFKGGLFLADSLRGLGLKDAELWVNDLPFTANGFVLPATEARPARINMDFGLKVSDLNDLLAFVPDEFFKNRDKIKAEGSILLDGDIRGELGDSVVPTINLCCKVEDGAYHVKRVEHGIDLLRLDVDLHLNGPHPDSSYVSLEELTVKGKNTSLTMSGEVWNMWDNPAIRARMNGQMDFTGLAKDFLNPDTLLLDGMLKADIAAEFTVDDVVNSRIDKIKAAGMLDIDRFKAFSKVLGVDMYIAGTRLFMGSTEKASRYLRTNEQLNATLTVDTLNLRYKEDIRTNIGGLRIVANTTPAIDTTAVIPLTAGVDFDHLRSRLPDSTWVIAGKTSLKGGIKGSTTDKKVPMAVATISVDTLRYVSMPLRSGMMLAGSRITLEALPYREAIRQRWIRERVASGDTTRRRPSAATRARRGRSARVDTTASDNVLRRWEARGHIGFEHMRGFSRMFPLPMRIDGTDLRFSTSNVTLSGARVRLGKSDFTLSGDIEGIRQSILRGGKLKATFGLKSDLLDCNQLMAAINRGTRFAERMASGAAGTFTEDSVEALASAPELETGLSADSVATDSVPQVFVVPKFLDVTFNTDAKKILFRDLELEEVKGRVTVKNQSVELSNLYMDSNIGSGGLTMIYTARDASGASMGFDLGMRRIQIAKLIGLFPAIDSLVPMLRSFEGVVDCQMTATCKADSTMSIELPSLSASCYLSGRDMVLLDGETFAEISKTLMFKNKERNMIDSIAVDLAIRDSKIEVFPFLVEMDRYKVAVGGTHNLDMTFDYHISVLKSPVPFKLGLNISGNLDDFKFRIGKCKYKDFLKPAKQAELDSTRRDVRQGIRDAIRRQIREQGFTADAG